MRDCAVSMSANFEPDGTQCSGGERPLTCPAICYFAFWPIGFRPTVWATSMSRHFASSTVQDQLLTSGNSQSSSINAGPICSVGTMLVREWDGQLHRVMVLADGFAWNEKIYPSLSKVAFAMTGTRWNGPRFFGLRDKLPKEG